jgi:YHS domain-containing protein
MSKVTAVTLGVILLVTGSAFAQQASPTAQTSAQSVEVENKICPVSGEKVGKMGPPIKYEYNGKIYNLCCPMCKKSFKKNPEKYSKIAEDEVKTEKKQ